MPTRSRWFGSFVPLVAVAFAACTDPGTSPPLSFDEVTMEEEETLKGDDIEVGGTCPDGYKLLDLGGKLSKVDLNGNGFICTNGFDEIDDTLIAEGPDTEFAGGHGNFDDVGKKGITQHVSFSFHGRQNKTMVVKGEFEMHDFINGLRIHGDVNCLIVAKNTAILGGIVTQSTDKQFPVGSSVAWTTSDNGEGINEPVDFISRPAPVKTPKEGCKGLAVPIKKPILIQSGNIQVLQ